MDIESLEKQALEDWKKIERMLRERLEQKIQEGLIDADEIEDLKKMDIPIPVNPNWVRPFFFDPILKPESLFFTRGGYNINPDLLTSSTRPFLGRLRKLLKPLTKLLGNFEAVIHKQAVFNDMQADYNTRLAHHVRLLHELVHRLVTELTKLKLEHDELKFRHTLLEEQLEWYKKRHGVLETLLLEEEKKRKLQERTKRHL